MNISETPIIRRAPGEKMSDLPSGNTPTPAAAAPDLKQRTSRGGLIHIGANVSRLVLRMGSLVVLARLLTPEDFGIVGMVVAFTGFLGLFRDAGLSLASIQREVVTEGQVSTLFWVNLAAGLALALIGSAGAPLIAGIYHEPRLVLITAVLSTGFLFNGAGAQHQARLERDLRFGILAVIEVSSLVASIAVAVLAAATGWGYWSLVAMSVVAPATAAVGFWLATGWIPHFPQRGTGVRSMLHYGGLVTLNNVVTYCAFNTDKVLLGRFAGASLLGLYGRAYQLMSLPTDNLNAVLCTVAFPALSKVQSDPVRFRRYFLHVYGVFLSLILPVSAALAIFSAEIVSLLLGPKWTGSAPLFCLLAPAITAFAFINPLGWLMLAAGRARQNLQVSLIIAPTIILGDIIGLAHGVRGVALGYSTAMTLLIIPVAFLSLRGTSILMLDLLKTASAPVLSTVLGSLAVVAARPLTSIIAAHAGHLATGAMLFGSVYLVALLFLFRQWRPYSDLLQASGIWPAKG